ncbi:MAG: hypothetical protein HZC28_20040 [Spirochaetes bacterium]|nr:hypothetical protein [Spirochaetota bacterium]
MKKLITLSTFLIVSAAAFAAIPTNGSFYFTVSNRIFFSNAKAQLIQTTNNDSFWVETAVYHQMRPLRRYRLNIFKYIVSNNGTQYPLLLTEMDDVMEITNGSMTNSHIRRAMPLTTPRNTPRK